MIESIINQLLTDYPDLKPKNRQSGKNEIEFPAGRRLSLSDDWLLGGHTVDEYGPCPTMLDELAEHLQEDLAIIRVKQSGENSLLYTNVCLPSGWRPTEKISRSFAQIHEPVKGFPRAQESKVSKGYVNQMIKSGVKSPVRFVWGIQFDDGLNQHPVAHPRTSFNPARPVGWLRVERQTFTGFPDRKAALFTIRIYVRDLKEVCKHNRELLCKALESMKQQDKEYKGLVDCRDELVKWIKSLPG